MKLVPAPKPFTWSYSRLKNFETCPKRHWHVDIQKDYREEEGEALLWGNQVHKAAAERLSKNTPLPPGMETLEKYCAAIQSTPGQILVEQKLAITKDFGKTGYFDTNVWFRAVGDVIKLNPPVAFIGDWKTGKIIEDSQQLSLAAACVFAHYPEIHKVRSDFIWLGYDAVSTAILDRGEISGMWRGIWPRIESLEHAWKTTEYPAKEGGLCKRFCPVKSCPHNGQ